MTTSCHQTSQLSQGMYPCPRNPNIIHPVPKIPTPLPNPPEQQWQSHQKRAVKNKSIAQMGEKMCQMPTVIGWVLKKEKQLTTHKNTRPTPQYQLTNGVNIHLQTLPVQKQMQKCRHHTQQDKKSVAVKGNPADMKQLGLHGLQT
jgi:hypothetical protein